MAKKKKQKFAHGSRKQTARAKSPRPVSTEIEPNPIAAAAAPAAKVASVGTPTPSTARWAYVGRDIRRIGILMTACIAVELVIAYLLDFTSVGTAVYGLIHL